MKKLLVLFSVLLFISCAKKEVKEEVVEIIPIVSKALNDKTSIHYVNFSKYPKNMSKFPIGIVDLSGDGKLVLEELGRADVVDNISGRRKKDMVEDLAGENFDVVCDVANFPFTDYLDSGKVDLLRELIVNNALFLLNDKFYENPAQDKPMGVKMPSKILILADDCVGDVAGEDIKNLLKLSGTDVKVVGVMQAGVNEILRNIKDNDTISVVALTENDMIDSLYKEMIYKRIDEGQINGGVHLTMKNSNSLESFWSKSKKNATIEDTIRTHITVLLNSYNIHKKPIDFLIVGKREYMPMTKLIKSLINEYKEYTDANGVPLYKGIISPNLKIINPMEMAAYECYKYLRDSNNLALNIHNVVINRYMSTPVLSTSDIEVDSFGNLTNNFKLNRECGTEKLTTVFVPFSDRYTNNNITNNKPN